MSARSRSLFLTLLAGGVLGAVPAAAAPLAPVPDNGFVTPVHKERAGTIVFAPSAAAVTTPEKPAQFTSTFTAGQPIFFRAYLPRSLENSFRAEGVECHTGDDVWRTYSMLVDGKPVGDGGEFYAEKMAPESFRKSTSIRFDQALNGQPDRTEKSPHRAYNDVVLPALTPGSHKLTLSVGGRCMARNQRNAVVNLQTPMAKGDFTVTVSAADAAKGGVQLPKAGKKDAKLEKEMAAVMKAKWTQDTILKVVIVDKDWTNEVLKTKKATVVTSRRIATKVAVKQGAKCRLFEVVFKQPAQKNKKFGPTEYYSTGDTDELPCQNVK
ncbi:MAG TPA: hypothetical protein VGQ83_39355 [Polyangia bacterium]|jgi:hypothetical protein